MNAKPNTLYPGRPHYVGPITGFFFLLHHDRLFEYSSGVAERVEYIKSNKPENEIDIRLWNICLFPPEKMPPEINKARAELDKVCAELDKACAELDKACAESVLFELVPEHSWDGEKLVFT